eukprot:6458844-Amphidinium_carterae.1
MQAYEKVAQELAAEKAAAAERRTGEAEKVESGADSFVLRFSPRLLLQSLGAMFFLLLAHPVRVCHA